MGSLPAIRGSFLIELENGGELGCSRGSYRDMRVFDADGQIWKRRWTCLCFQNLI